MMTLHNDNVNHDVNVQRWTYHHLSYICYLDYRIPNRLNTRSMREEVGLLIGRDVEARLGQRIRR